MMQDKQVIVAIIENGSKILLRKKPNGSPPYKETWYLLGTEAVVGEDINKTITNYLKNEVGIEVELVREIGKDEEIKQDHDGKTKRFIYTDILWKYKNGEPILPMGTEKIEWVEKEKLKSYDLVPPSVALFKKIGYII